MITKTIKKARKKAPYILFPYGAIKKERLRSELKKYDFSFPKELIELWIEFGGGDFYEVQSFLYPLHSDNDLIETTEKQNNYFKSKGLDNNYFVFETDGSYLSAFDKETHEVCIFYYNQKTGFKKHKQFKNINHWFKYFWAINQ